MAKNNNLNDFLTDIANTIRTKKGTTAEINAQNFSSEIASITTGIIPTGNINITNTNSTDVTNYATAKVVDSDLVASNIKKGVSILGITGTYDNDTLKALLDYSKSTASMFRTNTTIVDLTPYFSFNTTANVTDMSSMFYSATNLTTVPLFDTSNVTNMSQMFYNCTNLTTIYLFNTSKVTNMSSMFQFCSNIATIPAFNTSNATTMYGMFYLCSNLTTIPLFDTSKVTDMGYSFCNCRNLTELPAFDVSKVTTMKDMLYDCRSLTTIHCVNINCDLDISASTLFTTDSLFEIFDTGLKQQESGVTKTLTIGSTNLAKLDSEYIAWASSKGWTLA